MSARWRQAAEAPVSWPTTSRSPSTPSIHLIVTHEVTNVGTDRSQLAHVAKETKATLQATSLDVVADRGYFNSEEILACEQAGITVTLPKPMTSNSKAEGRFGKQDFRYVAEEDVYICPAGKRLTYHYTSIRRRCASGARRSSIPSERSRPGWGQLT